MSTRPRARPGPHRLRVGVSALGFLGLFVLVIVVSSGFSGSAGRTVPATHRVSTAATLAPAAGPSALSPWTNHTSGHTNQPAGRFSGAATWDANDSEVVLFGGIPGGGGALRTTWTFANGSWKAGTPHSLTTANSPSARWGAALAYDASDRYVVLFGGRSIQGGLLSDTWTFSAGTWTNVTNSTVGAPPGRANASIAYDPAVSAVVMFGGRSPTSLFNDTWEYHSARWTSVGASVPTPTNTPSHRSGASLAFLSSANALVLFGGTGFQFGTYSPLSDTWLFQTTGWQSIVPPHMPTARAMAALAPLPNGTILLYGGVGAGGPVADTWLFDGADWKNVSTSVGAAPSARSASAVAPVTLSGTNGYILLFGGNGPTSTYSDTWEVGASLLELTGGIARPAALDVNQSTNLSIVGFGPSAPLTYSWSSMPSGCTSTATAVGARLACVPPAPGNFTAIVSMNGTGAGSPVTASIPFVVNALPAISAIRVSPFPAVLGNGFLTLTVLAHGGTGGLHFSYAGLPPGCSTTDASFLRCAPSAVGTWTVTVAANDSTGASGSANATVVVAASAPAPPNHLLAKLTSPLAIATGVIGVGVVLLIVFALQRRRRLAARGSAPAEEPAEPKAPPPVR
ncbi:MAG: kelch motif-containing protein [Thermoplasmata archaeon]|nr:kelch motif-containing protein [Thermoplasmata archaeon]